MRIPVLNKRRDILPKGAVYVGRPSRLGNPFRIDKDGTREEVVVKYREYFLKRLRNDPEFAKLIDGLRRAEALVCWCAPEKCHADVIADYLEETRSEASC